MDQEQNPLCFHTISDAMARAELGEDEYQKRIAEKAPREERARAFEAELAEDGDLAGQFRDDPLGTLQERGILGPRDRLKLERRPPMLPDVEGFEGIALRLCYYVSGDTWSWECVRFGTGRICYLVYTYEAKEICVWA